VICTASIMGRCWAFNKPQSAFSENTLANASLRSDGCVSAGHRRSNNNTDP